MGRHDLEIDFAAMQIRKDERNGRYEKLKRTNRNIKIFGAGIYAHKLERYLKSIGIRSSGFIVDDAYYDKQQIGGVVPAFL